MLRDDNLIQLMAADSQIKAKELTVTLGQVDMDILNLSLKYNLMSSAVSFVVVEKHSDSVEVCY